MCAKVLLHINELGVHHSRHMYMLKNYFFPLSLSHFPKKKKGFFKIVVKQSTQTIHIKKRDLHQSNCSDSTHCFCCTNDVPVVEYCRWKGESLYRGWCSKTLFTESSLNFFGNTKDFPSTHIYHGL